MPTFRIEAPDGRTFDVTGPDGSTKEQALERVRATAGAAAPEPKAKPKMGPSQGGDDPRAISGALLDTLGVSGRPGAVPLAGNKGTKTPLGVVLKPENATEIATREAVMAPLTAASLPVRISAQAGMGALERLTSGHGLSDAGYAALLDATVAGITEGVMGYAGSKATKVAKPWLDAIAKNEAARRTFQWATQAPQVALDALRTRLPSGKWMRVPSVSGAKMTADDAVAELAKLTGAEYQQARAEIASELSRLDKQRLTGPKPVAGTVFNQRTSPERFVPPAPDPGTPMQRTASKVASTLNAPAARAVADTAATIPVDDESGVPVGGLPVLGAKDRLHSVARWLTH